MRGWAWFLLGAAACAPASVTRAPEVATSTNAVEDVLTIELDPGRMTYDPARGTATLAADTSVMAAAYTTWVLDLSSLEAALGARPSAPVSVVVRVTGSERRSMVPQDPTLPAPQGGFSFEERRAVVVGRAQP